MTPIAEDGSLRDLNAHPLSKTAQSTAQFRASTVSAPPEEAEALDPTFTLRGSSVPSNTANQLLHAICSRSWDVALSRLSKRPRDALCVVKLEVYGVERRILPLHLAVAVGAPAGVIRALLEADEEGEAVRDGTANKVREEKKGRKQRRQSKKSESSEPPGGKTGAQSRGGGVGPDGGEVPYDASQLGLGWDVPKSRPPYASSAHTSATQVASSKSLSSVMSASSATTAPVSNVSSSMQHSLNPVEVANSDGWTPLHLACLYRSSPHVVELLLDPESGFAGAAKVKSGYGLLPLHVLTSGLRCDRLRWSEDADGVASDGVPNVPESERSIDALWGRGDLPRTAGLLLRAFPGAVHVPCSRPLGGNGWTAGPRDGPPPTPGGGADVQLTPVQYARRYLPEGDDETREVLDLLEGRTRIKDAAMASIGTTGTGASSIFENAGASESFNSASTVSTGDGSRGSKDKKKRKKKKKKGGGAQRVQSLRTGEASKRRSSNSRSLFRSVAAAMHLIPSNKGKKPPDEALSSGRGGDSNKPTKLYTLILSHDWSGARERLVHRPEEAAVWTLVDASGDDGGDSDGGGGGRGNPAAPMIKKGSYKSGGDEVGEAEYACHRLPLHRACASKPPPELVKALVEAYPDGIRSREKFAMLPLHVACQRGASTSVITTLVDLYPSSTRERDAFGLLPLHLACTEGCSPDVLVALLRSYPGAVEETDNTGRRPADYVRESLQPNRDAMLRELGRDANYWFAPSTSTRASESGGGAAEVPGLYFAVAQKRWEDALELVASDPAAAGVWVIDDSGGDSGSDGASSSSSPPPRPRLPLHAACRRRAPPEVVRALISAHPVGASSLGGKLDLLPLHMACQYGGDAESVEELVRAYPEGTTEADKFGLLPIHLAVTEGASPAIIRILLRRHPHGARAKDRRGNTPLDYARASFHPNKEEVLELLGRDPESWSASSSPPPATSSSLSRHASDGKSSPSGAVESLTLTRLIERRDWNGVAGRAARHAGEAAAPRDTGDGEKGLLPLHRACAAGAPRHAIEALLRAYSAGAKTVSEKGDLPLHLACKQRASLDVVQALMEAYPLGASTRDGQGRLPVHLVCISGTTLPILEALLRASPGTAEMTDGTGRTPLRYAEESFHKNKVELIDALQMQRDQSTLGGAGAAHATELYDLVSARRWAEVVARAREAPSEASVWSIDGGGGGGAGASGRLPLHLACSLNPPRRAVAALVNAYVEGVRIAGRDGSTCLHAACAGGATVDVVQLLINAHPDAVSMRDQAGLLPIHIACSKSSSVEVIKLLIRASPEPVSAEDERSIAEASSLHPDRESILAELPPAPVQSDLRGRPVPMRSVPARLGVEDVKKHAGGSPSPVRGKALNEASLEGTNTVQIRTDTEAQDGPDDRRRTYVQMLSPARQDQSTKSLGGNDDEDESNLGKSMVQIPVISV